MYLYYSPTMLSEHSTRVCFWETQSRGCEPSFQTSDLIPSPYLPCTTVWQSRGPPD